MSVAVEYDLEPDRDALASYVEASTALMTLCQYGPLNAPLGPATAAIVTEYVNAALDYRLLSSVEGRRPSDAVTATIEWCRELLAPKLPDAADVPAPVSNAVAPILTADAPPADRPLHGYSRRQSARARWY